METFFAKLGRFQDALCAQLAVGAFRTPASITSAFAVFTRNQAAQRLFKGVKRKFCACTVIFLVLIQGGHPFFIRNIHLKLDWYRNGVL